MGKITFILGGARSGKSTYALSLAKAKGRRVAFVATCEPLDGEMRRRIATHKKNRPDHWKTFEEPLEPIELLKKIGPEFDIIIIDCLTLMLSNLVLKEKKKESIENKIREMLGVLKEIKSESIIVSNEVGLGIVPNNRLSREFRDIEGAVNQIVAKESSAVFFMVAGIPMKIKGK